MAGFDATELKHYDLQGYSRDEHVRRAESCFELRTFEVTSLNDIITTIHKSVKRQKFDAGKLATDLSYLDHLESKLMTILLTEEREGMVNLPLKRDLQFVTNLKNQVLNILQEAMGPVLG